METQVERHKRAIEELKERKSARAKEKRVRNNK
jgi:hypothetical protein